MGSSSLFRRRVAVCKPQTGDCKHPLLAAAASGAGGAVWGREVTRLAQFGGRVRAAGTDGGRVGRPGRAGAGTDTRLFRVLGMRPSARTAPREVRPGAAAAEGGVVVSEADDKAGSAPHPSAPCQEALFATVRARPGPFCPVKTASRRFRRDGKGRDALGRSQTGPAQLTDGCGEDRT